MPRLVDDWRREVEVPERVERIVSIAPSNTEIAWALGLGERLVGRSQYCEEPAEAQRVPVVWGKPKPIAWTEQILAAQPDLVLAVGGQVTSGLSGALEAESVPVLVLQPSDIESILSDILLVGRATGMREAAETLVERLIADVAEIEARVADLSRLRVFYEVDPNLYTVGPGSFLHDYIERGGGENIAASRDEPWPQLTFEEILAFDPQVILLGDVEYHKQTVDKVLQRPGWEHLTAVRTGRIHEVPLVTKQPGPRLAAGLRAIASALHPDRREA